jgi:hypothetical protein
MTLHGERSEDDLLRWQRRCRCLSLDVLRESIPLPEIIESRDAVPSETLPGFAQKDRVLLRDEPILLVVPLGLEIEITRQVPETLAFHVEREELSRLFLRTRRARNVEELETWKMPEQRPISAQVSDVRIQISVLGIEVSEGDHRQEVGRRIRNVERESVDEGDALAMLFGGEKQTLGNLEPPHEILAFGFRCLEIVILRVSEDVIECQEPGFDVTEFVPPAIPKISFLVQFGSHRGLQGSHIGGHIVYFYNV